MRRVLTLRSALILTAAAALFLCASAAERASATMPGGTDVIHVPMSWCILSQSPAATNPNVTDEFSLVTDTTTSAVIWRRHERPTDHIYMPAATISLRSAINNAWGGFTFPVFSDPLTDVQTPGDIRGDVPMDTTTLVHACEQQYANAGRAGIGITAVNVNRFEDANGPSNQTGYGTFSSKCTNGVCTYEGFIVVTDNHYLYPTVTGHPFVSDPFDELVGHEMGHALGLDAGFDSYDASGHSTNPTALMYPSAQDNDHNGRVDNTGIDATEAATLRAHALMVPGHEVDPAGTFVPGPALAMRLLTARNQGLRPNLDLAALTVQLDRKSKRVVVGQRLWGLLPCKSRTPVDYDYLLDLDHSVTTGASPVGLSRLRIPSQVHGADLVVRATVAGCHASGRAWVAKGGRLSPLRRGAFTIHVQTVRATTPDFPFPPFRTPPPAQHVVALWNTIDFSVRNLALPKPVRAKVPIGAAAVVASGGKARDRFPALNRGATFVLASPSFPHCFPAGTGTPGGTVQISFDGLRPNREIHALLGPELVLRGVMTDAKGAGQIAFPIPRGATPGAHLVTIGHDGLAITADCTLIVH